MTVEELIIYNQDICKIHPAILHTDEQQHFFRIDIEELIAGTRGFANYPAVTCDIPEIGYNGQTWDNLMQQWYVGLTFLDKAKAGDFARQVQVITRMQLISEDFFSQYKEDFKNNNIIKGLDYHQIKGYKVGPVFDGLYGWRLIIPAGNPAMRVRRYDRANWVKPEVL